MVAFSCDKAVICNRYGGFPLTLKTLETKEHFEAAAASGVLGEETTRKLKGAMKCMKQETAAASATNAAFLKV